MGSGSGKEQKRTLEGYRVFFYFSLLIGIIFLISSIYWEGLGLYTLGRVVGIFFVLLLIKYFPGVSHEIKEPKGMAGLNKKTAGRIQKLSIPGIILYLIIFSTLIIYSLLVFNNIISSEYSYLITNVFIILYIITGLLIFIPIYYFWYVTKNNLLYILSTLIVALFILFNLMVSITWTIQQEILIITLFILYLTFFSIAFLLPIIGFFYLIYITFKYIVPYLSPRKSDKTWAEIYREDEEEKKEK